MTILVGKKAPDFTTQAVLANDEVNESFNFASTIEGKYAVLFFYPLDFTFVCPTELIAMDNRMAKFKELGAEVVGVSIDSHWTHKAWRNTAVEDGGIGQVGYTLAADMNHAICQAYGVESDGGLSGYPAGAAMRATFVIDPEGKIQIVEINAGNIGRNAEELLRKVKAAQYVAAHPNEVCPAKWKEGEETLAPSLDLVGKI